MSANFFFVLCKMLSNKGVTYNKFHFEPPLFIPLLRTKKSEKIFIKFRYRCFGNTSSKFRTFPQLEINNNTNSSNNNNYNYNNVRTVKYDLEYLDLYKT